MNTNQLREEIVNKVLDEIVGKYSNPHDYIDDIMAAIKDHIDYVIGEDSIAPPMMTKALEKQEELIVKGKNELRAEQRNKAGHTNANM